MEVSDTGIGMSEEHIHHVFERFYQIDAQHTGSGLGLALVEAFVQLHKGTVRVESEKGKGTCFRGCTSYEAGRRGEGGDREK